MARAGRVGYLFVEVLSGPLPAVSQGGAGSFWTAADIVIALPVSWFPLVADYTRHVRGGRTAFVGTSVGYGAATVAFFALGVLALSAYGAAGLDVIGALLAVPLGAIAILVLLVVEVDEAFANIYSTAVSAQNVAARLDRRVLAIIVGAAATLLAFVLDAQATNLSCSSSGRSSCRWSACSWSRTSSFPAGPGTPRSPHRPGPCCCCRGSRASWRTS